MKKQFTLALWAIGSTFAILWTAFWIFGIIYTRKTNVGVLIMVGIGVFAAWHGFKTFREEKKSP